MVGILDIVYTYIYFSYLDRRITDTYFPIPLKSIF
ncbi:hypothetical protein MPF_0767 [Methanohalophilus portucalensis FDF-1]|uniref:Uncharacterized protein n=1 Tax=Methanohalophilus portucalensis FDF-1 TaxID=523843 RepID=A0A1L9C641_9EURY|nr:hypothetical protein MPF_0767 [Methanohalophilus portucalensis FDF-1]